MAFPLYNNDELFGVVYVEHSQALNAFTRKMVPVLTAIGTQFALSFESIETTERLDASLQTLRELATVSTWDVYASPSCTLLSSHFSVCTFSRIFAFKY